MESSPVSKSARITGWIMTVLPSLLFAFSAVMKFVPSPQLTEGFSHLQLPGTWAFGLGGLELSCLVIYLIPRTAVIGAILLTGYLGGAVATHLRVGSPLVGYTLFGVYLGIMLWSGLWLRDSRIRALLPLTR